MDTQQTVAVPTTSLIVLCGPSGTGKSTFARQHFQPSQIVSSDQCRMLVADDAANQVASRGALEVLYAILEARLRLGRLTVVDSLALTKRSRLGLRRLARAHDFVVHLIVFDVPQALALERNARRDRRVPRDVIARQYEMLARTLHDVREEGFDRVTVLRGHEPETAHVRVEPWPFVLLTPGRFDIIGDVHGCIDELVELLTRLGYRRLDGAYRHPERRTAVFVGDLVDRGPDAVGVVRIVDRMVRVGSALSVQGNHDDMLLRYLRGNEVAIEHGLDRTLAQIDALPAGERDAFVEMAHRLFERTPPYVVLDNWQLVVSHAGIESRMIGRLSRRIKRFCLIGDPTGEYTADGRPIRRDWARDYHGRALIVYGHTPVPEAEFVNNTVNIDGGCVYGGRLTALRYPERELVSVPSRQPLKAEKFTNIPLR